MAATQTVAQALQFCKSGDSISPLDEIIPSIRRSVLQPRRGVVVLHGYGINVRVERGHLVLESGVGSDRYKGRFARVGHGLERLVVVGADGVVSLSALRWLADQNASFVMLERDGTVMATTGPVRPSDIKLRRAQALAHQTGLAFRMSRELIDRKLAGQERIARESLQDEPAATLIRQFRSELAEVESIDAIRFVESRAAKTYWKAWRAVSITFPDKELPRIPDHWRSFGSRVSPLSGSPRLAANPVNAILNYLYAVLEAECRLAVAALGLDPEMGVLHMDTTNRDSLACDLMEPIRAEVDDLVCGQGRMEAFIELGESTIPAIVIQALEQDRQLMSLVENIARRPALTRAILIEVRTLRERGNSREEIAFKLGLDRAYLYGICHLIDKSEEFLVASVEAGRIPLSVAVEIASGNDDEVSKALSEAYEKGDLRGTRITAARRIITQRVERQRLQGKVERVRRKLTGEALVREYKQKIREQTALVVKANRTRDRLILLTSAARILFADENFCTLLKAEGMQDMPVELAERLSK
jgi:CRISPR-associated endonuclease Cas1